MTQYSVHKKHLNWTYVHLYIITSRLCCIWHILWCCKSTNNNTAWLTGGMKAYMQIFPFLHVTLHPKHPWWLGITSQRGLLGVWKTEQLWITNEPYFHLSLSHSHRQPCAARHLSMQSVSTCSQSLSSDCIISDSFMSFCELSHSLYCPIGIHKLQTSKRGRRHVMKWKWPTVHCLDAHIYLYWLGV